MLVQIETCCPFMATLRNDDYCYLIHLDSSGRLTTCDDYEDRLPPLNFCPWCREEIAQDVLPSGE